MDATIQVKFWIDHCIMDAKYDGINLPLYVIMVINNKNIKTMECIVIMYSLNNVFMCMHSMDYRNDNMDSYG